MDQNILVKEEFIEERKMDYDVKEENDSNPWLIENAESFLKYCYGNGMKFADTGNILAYCGLAAPIC